MRHIKKILSYSMVGSLGLAVVANLQGCTPQEPEEQKGSEVGDLQSDLENENFFLVIEQTEANPDRYALAEKHPTEGPTRAVMRDLEGNEKILSPEELKALAEEEAAKVEAGTSNLTQENSASPAGGLGLGETILAAAAGALIGGMIANKLAGNSNFQRNQQMNTRPAAAYNARPFNKTGGAAGDGRSRTAGAGSSPKSGFLGGNKSPSSAGGARSFGG